MACRFLIFEEQLYDGKSHHLTYYDSILSAADKSGNAAVLYANREAEEFVCQRLNAIPALWTMAGLAASGPRRVQNSFLRALLLAKHLFKNFLVCTSAVKKHRPDVVLCLSTWIPHVLLFLLVALRLGRSMPKLVLLFVWYPRIGKAKSRSFRLVRFFLRWLLKVHPRTYIFAETRYAMRAWEEFSGVPVSYVVHPVEAAERRVAPEDRRSEIEVRGELVHKSSGGEGSGSMSPIEESSCAGAKPELPVCEQGRCGGHYLTTKSTNLHERGEEVSTTNGADIHGYQKTQQGDAQGTCAGASEPDLLTSKLADASVSESLIRSADGPALARIVSGEMGSVGGNKLADSGEFLEDQSQASLQMDSQKHPTPRAATGSDTSGKNSSSVPIREIRGQNSGPLDAGRSALDAPAEPVVFGFYGFARHEQGVDVLMRALEILKDQGELDAEFRIAWPKAFQMPDGSWMDREMFGHLGSNVRFYVNPLSPEDYLRELSETDWLILPYRVGSYEGRCSRISIEACVMGIPVIYSEGTDLEEVVRLHGEGIGVPEEDAGALASAIRLAIQENQLFQEKALSKQAAAQDNFSGRSFLEAILGEN